MPTLQNIMVPTDAAIIWMLLISFDLTEIRALHAQERCCLLQRQPIKSLLSSPAKLCSLDHTVAHVVNAVKTALSQLFGAFWHDVAGITSGSFAALPLLMAGRTA